MSEILAVISMFPDKVGGGGGAPIFLAKNEEELEELAFLLEKIMDAMSHDLKNGTKIIVKH